jgi:hypothetical protein
MVRATRQVKKKKKKPEKRKEKTRREGRKRKEEGSVGEGKGGGSSIYPPTRMILPKQTHCSMNYYRYASETNLLINYLSCPYIYSNAILGAQAFKGQD